MMRSRAFLHPATRPALHEELSMIFKTTTLLASGVLLLSSAASCAEQDKPRIADDGTVYLPARQVPFSSLASKEARAEFIKNFQGADQPSAPSTEENIQATRSRLDREVLPLLELQRKRYAVSIRPTKIAGV